MTHVVLLSENHLLMSHVSCDGYLPAGLFLYQLGQAGVGSLM